MRYLSLALSLALVTACGADPVAPTPLCQDRTATNVGGPLPCTYAPVCQTNHTGTVTVTNNGSRTIDILWNGAVKGTLTPGQTSPEFTVVAGGAQYVLDEIVTNTQFHPCGTLLATPLQCQVNTYGTCRF